MGDAIKSIRRTFRDFKFDVNNHSEKVEQDGWSSWSGLDTYHATHQLYQPCRKVYETSKLGWIALAQRKSYITVLFSYSQKQTDFGSFYTLCHAPGSSSISSCWRFYRVVFCWHFKDRSQSKTWMIPSFWQILSWTVSSLLKLSSRSLLMALFFTLELIFATDGISLTLWL